jgi:hypothetical protein
VVVGGSLRSDSPILEYFRGFPPNAVKFITAAGINPIADGASIGAFFLEAGIQAEWIPVHDTNCNERTRDPVFVQMVNEAEAIYMSGGQAGRLQSCLFGSYDQSGTEGGEVTPFLAVSAHQQRAKPLPSSTNSVLCFRPCTASRSWVAPPPAP